MTATEFSNEFDLSYNNIMSNAAPGLNEYEKSVFLTKAQEELIKNYFNPKGNKYQEGFDDSVKRQIDFSELVDVGSLVNGDISITTGISIDLRTKFFLLPEDVFLILNETAEVNDGGKTFVAQVIPLHFVEYQRLMSKPYKEPLKWQV